MSTHTVSVFNNTIAKTNVWLDEIMDELDWNDPKRAYKALRDVLHVLRDLLSVEEAADLAAQLPMLIRGFYFEGWKPNHAPLKIRTVDQFLEIVNRNFEEYREPEFGERESITRAVFKVLAKHVSAGEIQDIVACLPDKLRVLWDTE